MAGEEDHHDEQEEHGEENAEAEGHHDEHDEDGMRAGVRVRQCGRGVRSGRRPRALE